MNQFKHIITSGCSFSDPRSGFTWPLHLKDTFSNCTANNVGLTSQGNGIIARKAIHAVHSALSSGIDAKDILVGIMWSGPDRHDTFFEHLPNQLDEKTKLTDFMIENPTSFVEGASGGWLIMNSHWKERIAKIYYSYLHDTLNHRINTYEKILWTQLYLKSHNIKYFMTAYTDEVFERYNDDPNVVWMKEQIDWSNWLPIKSMHNWCYKYWTDDDFPTLEFQNPETGKVYSFKDNHPNRDMHIRFTKEVILEHIKEKFSNYECPEFREHQP